MNTVSYKDMAIGQKQHLFSRLSIVLFFFWTSDFETVLFHNNSIQSEIYFVKKEKRKQKNEMFKTETHYFSSK